MFRVTTSIVCWTSSVSGVSRGRLRCRVWQLPSDQDVCRTGLASRARIGDGLNPLTVR
jgi:hypothetical protein